MKITRKELAAIRDLMDTCVVKYRMVICGDEDVFKTRARCTGCGKEKPSGAILSMKHSKNCPYQKYWEAWCVLAKLLVRGGTLDGPAVILDSTIKE